MTSSLFKKILIEQAELDRLQQRQLRDYSPELPAMARLLNNIKDIISRKKLFAEKRLNLISDLQIQFDKLKNKTAVLSGAFLAQVAPEAPPVLPKVLDEKSIGPESVLRKRNRKWKTMSRREKTRTASSGERFVACLSKSN